MRRFFRHVGAITAVLCLLAPAAARSAAYRVLAIRVDFPFEEPDHETTSGRGVFDLRDFATDSELQEQYVHPWDVPPHDRDYFTHHLDALAHYWDEVSDGTISITYDIWPRELNSAYTMSRTFYKYGNGRTSDETFEKLAGLVDEAVTACKTAEDNAIDFSQYDTIIIIHAGIGSETSGVLNDITSASLDRDDFLTYLGGDVIVDGRVIEHAIVVPEMTSTNGNGGLNGIFAQMFGFRLGLPSLSNNYDGLPAAGGWALMDIGAMAWGYRTLGFLPTHPSIWSKIELGLVEPVVVTADTTIDIAATDVSGPLPRGIRIPITDDEYLLIENRFSPTPHDSLPPGIVFSNGDSTGVWLSSGNQDGFIPGSGVLVWHINDSIIAAGRDDNTLNDDFYRRGVDLLEADGRQDIGAFFSFGDNRSEYSIGHEDDTYKSDDVATISPRTNPDTGSMWGGSSGVTVTVNSPPGEVMNLTINFAGKLPGFPVPVPGARHITAADLDDDGVDELIVSTADSFRVVASNGTRTAPVFSYAHPPLSFEPTETRPVLYASIVDACRNYIYQNNGLSMASGGLNYDFLQGIAYYADAPLITTVFNNERRPFFNLRVLYANGTFDYNMYSNFSYNQSFTIPDSAAVVSVSAMHDWFATLNTDNDLALGYLGDFPATVYSTHADSTTGPLLVDIDRDDVYETVITADRELRIYEPDGTYRDTLLPADPVGDPVAADIDNDGYPEIILATRDQIFAFRADAAIATGFPFDLPPGDDDEQVASQPVVGDLDGDGSPDIAFTTTAQRLISFETNGLLTPGFPIALPGMVTESPCLFRGDGAGTLAIACLAADGTILAYDIGVAYDGSRAQWPMWKGGPELSGAFLNERIAAPLKDSASFEFFCYPNPVTGDHATFRLVPASDTGCTVTLYTVDGKKVFEASRTAGELRPGVANDIGFDSSQLASGLYIARIETAGQSRTYKVGVQK